MTRFRAHYDGRVLVPDEPIDLPVGASLDVSATAIDDDKPPLVRLLELAQQFPDDPDAPTDGAAQHDHYLYGTPKRP